MNHGEDYIQRMIESAVKPLEDRISELEKQIERNRQAMQIAELSVEDNLNFDSMI